MSYYLAANLNVLHTDTNTFYLNEKQDVIGPKQHHSTNVSRSPAAKTFSVLYLARWSPEFSRITILISALSDEKHMHFLNHLDIFTGVKYEMGVEGRRVGVQKKMDHGYCAYIFQKNCFLYSYLL